MKLDGYLIGTDIENENLVLRLYVGDYDVNYKNVEESCALIIIQIIDETIDELKNKFDKFTKEAPHVLIISNETELIITFTYSEGDQIHIPIIKEPIVSFQMDYQLINWKMDMIFERLNSISKDYYKLSEKFKEINNFLNNEYSNTQKKIEYFINKSNSEILNELKGIMNLIEKLLRLIPLSKNQ